MKDKAVIYVRPYLKEAIADNAAIHKNTNIELVSCLIAAYLQLSTDEQNKLLVQGKQTNKMLEAGFTMTKEGVFIAPSNIEVKNA